MNWGRKQLRRFPLFYNLSPVHHCQLIAEMLYYPQIMGNKQISQTVLFL